MVQEDGLIVAYELDGKGGGESLDWERVEACTDNEHLLWVHLDYEDPDARRWLRESGGLTPLTLDALLAHDPRPRSLQVDDGLMVVIRGVNSNVGAEPEDMVSLRMWIENKRVISLRHRKFEPTRQLRDQLRNGDGPRTAADFLHKLYDLSLAPITELVDQVDVAVDKLEDEVLSSDESDVRHRLGLVRRQSIILRRHVGPQRLTLDGITRHNVSWLTDLDRLNLGEAAEATSRILEELDSARERAGVTSEELSGRLSQLMDRRLYVLSMIAAVSLPLGILTGLLGVNVGGIPLTGNEYGFPIVCALLGALTILQLWLFRRLQWL